MAATAMPKNREKTTSCRMSPRAMASITEVGNRCRKMSQACCWLCAIAAAAGRVGAALDDLDPAGGGACGAPDPLRRAVRRRAGSGCDKRGDGVDHGLLLRGGQLAVDGDRQALGRRALGLRKRAARVAE